MKIVKKKIKILAEAKRNAPTRIIYGAPDPNRTGNLLLRRQSLYPKLSYRRRIYQKLNKIIHRKNSSRFVPFPQFQIKYAQSLKTAFDIEAIGPLAPALLLPVRLQGLQILNRRIIPQSLGLFQIMNGPLKIVRLK